MKPKMLPVIFFMLCSLLLIWGCATNQGAMHLVDYTNQGLLNIAELERTALEHYASVVGENYTTDQRVYDELKENVIPLYKRFLDGLRDIHPVDEEIRMVHGMYINGAELIYDGFKTKMLGLEMDNEQIIIQGNEKIVKGREEVEKWRVQLIELYKKYGVAQVKEKEEGSKK